MAREATGSVARQEPLTAFVRPGMGWATGHIAKLLAGHTVQFRPYGGSMMPRIRSGQLCTVAPADKAKLEVGDVVLCRVGATEYLHLIKAIDGDRFQIGNNLGRINGWVDESQIFGTLIRLEQ